MSKLLERIDQKLSFILSSLVGKGKVEKEDIEDLEIEKQILEEQFENEQELLFTQTELALEEAEQSDIILLSLKIVNNALLVKGFYDGEDEKENIQDSSKYDEVDIMLLQTKKDEVLEYLKNEFEDIEHISYEEILREVEDTINE